MEDGNPPLDRPGMRIYENAKAIQASLQNCLTKKGGPSLEVLFRIISKADTFTETYTSVKRWMEPIQRIAQILEPEDGKTSDSVRENLKTYLP